MHVDRSVLSRYPVVYAGTCAQLCLPYDNFYLKHCIHIVCASSLSQLLEALWKVTSLWRDATTLLSSGLRHFNGALCRVKIGSLARQIHTYYRVTSGVLYNSSGWEIVNKYLKRYEASRATASVLHICMVCEIASVMLWGTLTQLACWYPPPHLFLLKLCIHSLQSPATVFVCLFYRTDCVDLVLVNRRVIVSPMLKQKAHLNLGN